MHCEGFSINVKALSRPSGHVTLQLYGRVTCFVAQRRNIFITLLVFLQLCVMLLMQKQSKFLSYSTPNQGSINHSFICVFIAFGLLHYCFSLINLFLIVKEIHEYILFIKISNNNDKFFCSFTSLISFLGSLSAIFSAFTHMHVYKCVLFTQMYSISTYCIMILFIPLTVVSWRNLHVGQFTF